MKYNVFIGDNFYDVEIGTVLHIPGINALIGETLLFQSRLDVQIFGKVVEIDYNNIATLEIIDIKVNGISQKAAPVMEEIVIEEPAKEELFKVVEVPEEEIIEEEEDDTEAETATTDFSVYTKKELIAYIKENNLNINTVKKNKADILSALEKALN